METEVRSDSPALERALRESPERFNFFEYVRLSEGFNYIAAQKELEERRYPVGFSWPRNMEVLSFSAKQEFAFPYTQISRSSWGRDGYEAPSVEVTFMGLTGIAGVLPTHYTRMIMQQNRLKNTAMDQFFNGFNHRAVSFYYRCWAKSQLPASYESARRAKKRDDVFTRILDCLSGFGMPALLNRLSMPQDAVLHYAGYFCQHPHNAINLCYMLNDFFDVEIDIFQFKGAWEAVDKSERTCLPSHAKPKGQYNILSQNASLGGKIWLSQNHFRLKVGPLSYKKFESFLPTGSSIKSFVELARTYAGPQFSFELQLDLNPDEIPICQLNADNPPRLSWETWLNQDESGQPSEKQDSAAVVLCSSIMRL
ncbi:MAG: type VI secretion system baseplate subunit TssG [Gammaproteobacteria bacterium]|nr:type VI secretion system baseplate subunit TssG [Gammaproteobacteria bacterium]MCH9743689.1 type VI secretion system baseplate subunit TssG [Gammaproteobacteria bacterium]